LPEHEDLLVVADRVYGLATGPQPTGSGNAVLLRNGRIAALGSRDSLKRLAPGARVLDLPGMSLTPGLVDAHIHLTEWAFARREIDLGAASSPAAAAQAVGARAAGTAGWIRGRGWNPNLWQGAEPHRLELDRVTADRPVALQSHDMHALWVNSAALAMAGVDGSVADPAGGRIVRDADGQPTGLLLENATQLVTRVLPAPSLEDGIAAVTHAQAELHRLGITGVHSLPGIHTPEPDPRPVLEAMRGRASLRLRVLQHFALPQLEDALRAGVRSGEGDEWIRTGAVKMFLDGTLGSRTAWLRRPYENAAHCGMCVLPREVFRDAVRRAAAGDIATVVHAIGDAAVATAFEVLADVRLPRLGVPHRVEHVQCCPPEHFALPAAAGIVCSMQPAHLISDWRAADRHWGPERAARTYAFRSLLQNGATLAFGSDAPVEPVDPRLALFAATCRTDPSGQPAGGWYPDERISLEQAFRGFTNGAAIAAGAAAEQGQLAPGAYADLVAWEGDPLAVTGHDLLRLSPAVTIVAGEIVSC
jgi:predicted amidohydrolase YtcJ